MSEQTNGELVSAIGASRILSCCYPTIYKMWRRGELPNPTLGPIGQMMWRQADVEALKRRRDAFVFDRTKSGMGSFSARLLELTEAIGCLREDIDDLRGKIDDLLSASAIAVTPMGGGVSNV